MEGVIDGQLTMRPFKNKSNTVEPCILEQIDYLWGLAMAKAMI